jgi:transcriptional regulator with XRE-family HTH domain
MGTDKTQEPSFMTLSERVRQLLKDRDWSQAQLAQATPQELSIAPPPHKLCALCATVVRWRGDGSTRTGRGRLTNDTDTSAESGGELDTEFVATLTKAHGSLVSDNARLNAELQTAQSKVKQLSDELQRLNRQIADLQLSLDRESRSRLAAETEKHATEVRERELTRQVSALKTERTTRGLGRAALKHPLFALLQTGFTGSRQRSNMRKRPERGVVQPHREFLCCRGLTST